VHEHAPALNVAEYLLFRGRSSRLYQRLIYQESLAIAVSGGIHLRRDPSTFVVRTTAQPGVDIDAVRAAILETIDSLHSSPPAERELDKARNQIAADFAFSQEHNAELAQGLGGQECRSTWQDFFRFEERCLEVTAEEVASVVEAHLHERNRTTGYLVPERGEA
jgi:predicted Zn-dependent peptidase